MKAWAPKAQVLQLEKSPCSNKDPEKSNKDKNKQNFLKEERKSSIRTVKKIRTPFSNVVSYFLNYFNINLHLYLIEY